MYTQHVELDIKNFLATQPFPEGFENMFRNRSGRPMKAAEVKAALEEKLRGGQLTMFLESGNTPKPEAAPSVEEVKPAAPEESGQAADIPAFRFNHRRELDRLQECIEIRCIAAHHELHHALQNNARANGYIAESMDRAYKMGYSSARIGIKRVPSMLKSIQYLAGAYLKGVEESLVDQRREIEDRRKAAEERAKQEQIHARRQAAMQGNWAKIGFLSPEEVIAKLAKGEKVLIGETETLYADMEGLWGSNKDHDEVFVAGVITTGIIAEVMTDIAGGQPLGEA